MIEYKRKVSYVHVTELGLYHQGQLPNGYTGPYLTVEVVHSVIFVKEPSNDIEVFKCNPPKAKDSAGAVVDYDPSKIQYIVADTLEPSEDTSKDRAKHIFTAKMKTEVEARIAAMEKNKDAKGNPLTIIMN